MDALGVIATLSVNAPAKQKAEFWFDSPRLVYVPMLSVELGHHFFFVIFAIKKEEIKTPTVVVILIRLG